MQGATVDGRRGLAYPKESKLEKYFSEAVGAKVHQSTTTPGGVWRPRVLQHVQEALNSVWGFIESFNDAGARYRPLPAECRAELLRFLALLPLVRMNFRLDNHPMVTCSDASTTGGGVCRSSGLR